MNNCFKVRYDELSCALYYDYTQVHIIITLSAVLLHHTHQHISINNLLKPYLTSKVSRLSLLLTQLPCQMHTHTVIILE